MNWRTLLGLPRPPYDDDDVDEELMFHLRARIEDNRASGLSDDAAWDDARRRMGSLRKAEGECRPRSPGAMIVVICVVVGFSVIGLLAWRAIEHGRDRELAMQQLQETRGQMTALRDDLASSVKALSNNTKPGETVPFRGHITAEGRPVSNAKIAIVVKTWPHGRYRQMPYFTTTNATGDFVLDGAVPAEGRFALLASVAGDGYALESSYRIYDEGAAGLEVLEISLEPGTPFGFVVRDQSGNVVPNAMVTPVLRATPNGETHLVYFDSSAPLRIAADGAGRVSTSLFQRGDQADFLVQIPGRDWQDVSVMIPASGDEVVIPARG